MRKELVLEGAGPQLDDWREAYVDKLTTQLPKAVVLPMGHTIEISRRGQRVWIALSKKDSDTVRVVTATRSTLIPLAIVFFVIATFYLVGCVASYVMYLSYYMSNSHLYSPYPPYYYVLPFIPVITIFFTLGAGLLFTNKTREIQSKALQIARDTWSSFSRHVEEKVFPRPVPSLTPPKTRTTIQPDERNRTSGNYCMYCGTCVENPAASFCESCGNSLLV